MQYDTQNPYAASMTSPIAAAAEATERERFIRRTYLHLFGAIAVFIFIEAIIFMVVPQQTLFRMAAMMLTGWNWLLVLGAFMVVSWVAENMASGAKKLSTQYAGLGLYVVAEAVIFVPLLILAQIKGAAEGQNLILEAGIITALSFAGLTAIVAFSGADFSWMRSTLITVTWVGLAVIVASIFMGFTFGLLLIGLFIAIACGWILYTTSQVLHKMHTDQYVAASLALFASVALLFWYILQLLYSRD